MKERSVYISYAPEQASLVARLKAELAAARISISLDRYTLDKELRWKPAVAVAISDSGLFLACFSSCPEPPAAVYMKDELALAITRLGALPPGRRWLVPLLLTPCELPVVPIDEKRSVRDLEFIALDDWDAGVQKLIMMVPETEVVEKHVTANEPKPRPRPPSTIVVRDIMTRKFTANAAEIRARDVVADDDAAINQDPDFKS